MAVSESDVLHVAVLARLAIEPSRLPALVQELNGILGHMEELGAVDTDAPVIGGQGEEVSTPMRSDQHGSPISLVVPRESFAPVMRDGFFLVPRLETHEDQGERSP